MTRIENDTIFAIASGAGRAVIALSSKVAGGIADEETGLSRAWASRSAASPTSANARDFARAAKGNGSRRG
jgi:hypothetical protein